MKASNFSDAQKTFMLKQGTNGMPVAMSAARPGLVTTCSEFAARFPRPTDLNRASPTIQPAGLLLLSL
jgi:hypothetical protein